MKTIKQNKIIVLLRRRNDLPVIKSNDDNIFTDEIFRPVEVGVARSKVVATSVDEDEDRQAGSLGGGGVPHASLVRRPELPRQLFP